MPSLRWVLGYFYQVRRASDVHLYYVALATALMIPDICSAMETPEGLTNRPSYVAWCDKWVAPKYATPYGDHLTGEDCYGLRCSMLHQGRLSPHRGGYSRVLFVEPQASGKQRLAQQRPQRCAQYRCASLRRRCR
jgi:hypothetical protein